MIARGEVRHWVELFNTNIPLVTCRLSTLANQRNNLNYIYSPKNTEKKRKYIGRFL